MRPKRVVICPRCELEKPHYAKGHCNTCYKRKFYPRPNQRKEKPSPILRLAQLRGATEAAELCGVDLETYIKWIRLEETPTKQTMATIRELVEEYRKAEING